MRGQSDSLRYAVRFRVVGKYLGTLTLVLSWLGTPPLLVSIVSGAYGMALRHALSVCALYVGGFALSRLPAPRRVQPNEALVTVALAFGLASVSMAFPLTAGGLGFVDALFEAVSGITTTGLTVLPDIDGAGTAMHFSRAWMQWYGGLGFLVLSVALVVNPGVIARGLARPEVESFDLVGSTRLRARTLSGVYAVITLSSVSLLWLLGMRGLDPVLFACSAVSTGGFSPYSDSLSRLSFGLQAGVTAVCVAGALPLPLYCGILGRRWRSRLLLYQVAAFVLSAMCVSALLSASFQLQGIATGGGAVCNGFFTGFSAQTTSGFSTLGVGGLSGFSKGIAIVSMLTGGCVGSTAGGMKMLRLLIVFQACRHMLVRTSLTRHAVSAGHLGAHRIGEDELRDSCLLILLLVCAAVLSWLAFLLAGHNPLDSLFEVSSALGTVGLSSGLTGSGLHWCLKLVLCADMLLGRLEVLAWLVLFHPFTWFGRRMETP